MAYINPFLDNFVEFLIYSHLFSIPAMVKFKGMFVNRDVTSKQTRSSNSLNVRRKLR